MMVVVGETGVQVVGAEILDAERDKAAMRLDVVAVRRDTS